MRRKWSIILKWWLFCYIKKSKFFWRYTQLLVILLQGFVKQYNQELWMSSITRRFTKRLQLRPLKWSKFFNYDLKVLTLFVGFIQRSKWTSADLQQNSIEILSHSCADRGLVQPGHEYWQQAAKYERQETPAASIGTRNDVRNWCYLAKRMTFTS